MNLPYSNSTADRLLGCLIQHPTLCLEDKYKLDKSEFKINKFHQILFISIYNLAINGYKSISIFDLNEFLKALGLCNLRHIIFQFYIFLTV